MTLIKKNNKEGSEFKVGDHVRISKYKNIFAKGCVLNWSEEVFVITKVKNTFPWAYVGPILEFKGSVRHIQKGQPTVVNAS